MDDRSRAERERASTDRLERIRIREKARIEDRLSQLDTAKESAGKFVLAGSMRPGYTWDQALEQARLRLMSAVAAIGDDAVADAADALLAIDVPYGEAPAPAQELRAAFATLVTALASARKATFESGDGDR